MTDLIMVNGEAADVPAILASKWGKQPAAGYNTGGWPVEWTAKDYGEFARHISIDQQPAIDPATVRGARCRDFEPRAAGAASAGLWLEERERGDHFEQSTAYCSLEEVPAVMGAAAAGALEVPRWWLAWWWNRPGHPTRDQVLAELRRLTGVELPPDRLWACQYRSDPQWELSVVYGTPDFDR